MPDEHNRGNSAGETQANRLGDLIDLGAGHPGPDLLPGDLLLEAARSRLGEGEYSPLQYGLERGGTTFRRELAGFIGRRDGREADAEALFVTSGASQALDLLCTRLTRPGDLVLTTDPTYHLALQIFADHGLRVRGVPSDGGGPDLEALEELLRDGRPALLYLVPFFANPGGYTLAAGRRERLHDLALEHDFWIVADEVYRFLSFTGGPPESLVPQDEGERNAGKAISLNSFSKILAPGLRLGWVEGPASVLHALETSGLLQSGGGLNPFTSALVGELLSGRQLDEHLDWLLHRYAERAAALEGALREHLPAARFESPAGGYFIWLEVPGWDAAQSLPAARELGVNYHPGQRFSAQRDFTGYCRLSFAFYPPAELRDGAIRLARAVESQHLQVLSPASMHVHNSGGENDDK